METSKYKGRISEVFEKEVESKGRKIVFEIVRRPPGTRLIIPKEGKILMTKEFRYELNGFDYRLPGGKVFDTFEDYSKALGTGADMESTAAEAAKKEAHEEAGINANKLSLFHKSVCGATITWDLYYFVVNEFEETAQHLEDDEDIELAWVEREEAKKMCLDGRVSEERSALVLLRYLEGTI